MVRFSLKQNIVVRNIKENLAFYLELAKLDFVTLGYDTINDITACPGTDTWVASSTGIAEELERVLKLEFHNTKRIEKSLLN
jgi:sulfite reductase (ferredoxin)